MKGLLFRIILFVLLLVAIVVVNAFVFRSELPMLWFLTLLGSVILLLFFPYKRFFNNKTI